MMLSKSQLTHLRSLSQKKVRAGLGLFIAEGDKLVRELLRSSLRVKAVYGLAEWLKKNKAEPGENAERIEVKNEELERISSLVTPQDVLAVVEIPRYQLEEKKLLHGYTLLLDGIRDPGNMGTIIRIADWFGIRDIVCSPDSAETWNPKVVQASMGSLLRVRVYEAEPKAFLENMHKAALAAGLPPLPVYGTFLEGKNIYETKFPRAGILIIGNEANGIRGETEALVTDKITIPSPVTEASERPESLNAAIATAIVCAEIRRG